MNWVTYSLIYWIIIDWIITTIDITTGIEALMKSKNLSEECGGILLLIVLFIGGAGKAGKLGGGGNNGETGGAGKAGSIGGARPNYVT